MIRRAATSDGWVAAGSADRCSRGRRLSGRPVASGVRVRAIIGEKRPQVAFNQNLKSWVVGHVFEVRLVEGHDPSLPVQGHDEVRMSTPAVTERTQCLCDPVHLDVELRIQHDDRYLTSVVPAEPSSRLPQMIRSFQTIGSPQASSLV